MKTNLVLSLLFVFVAFGTAFPQQEPSDFEKLLLAAKKHQVSGESFIGALVKSAEDESVEVKLAFTGYRGPYQIEITPLIVKNGESCKLSSTKIGTPSMLESNVLNSPTVIIPHEENFNAVEISFSFADESAPRITLPFLKEKPTSGTILRKKRRPVSRTPSTIN